MSLSLGCLHHGRINVNRWVGLKKAKGGILSLVNNIFQPINHPPPDSLNQSISVSLSVSPSQSLGRTSVVWMIIFRAPRSRVGHWLEHQMSRPTLLSQAAASRAMGGEPTLSTNRTAGLRVQMKCEFAREGAWPVFYESWLQGGDTASHRARPALHSWTPR